MLLCSLFFSKYLFDAPHEDPNYNPLPEDRPGGFEWGQGAQVGDRNQDPPRD